MELLIKEFFEKQITDNYTKTVPVAPKFIFTCIIIIFKFFADNSSKDCGSSETIDINTLVSYTLTSPGYPQGYKTNLNCEWIFSTISMNHLVVHIMDINLKNFQARLYSCNDDYVSFYQKGSQDNDWMLIKKVCNTDDHVTKYHFTNLLKVQFVTNRYLNGTGFKANIEQSKNYSSIYFENNNLINFFF